MNILSGNEIEGIYLRETKGRFLCQVLVGKIEYECYLPSSCKMSKLLDLQGKTVLLRPITNKKTRTKYSVVAVRMENGLIPTNLAGINDIIADSLNLRAFSFLGPRRTILREAQIEGYKADIYVKDTNTLIEIKTIISSKREALFPTVYSSRAEKQLEKILELQEKYKAVYIFAILNPMTKKVVLNTDMKNYQSLFFRCIGKGMNCRVVVIDVDEIGSVKIRQQSRAFIMNGQMSLF